MDRRTLLMATPAQALALALGPAALAQTSRTLTSADVHRADYPTVKAVQWMGQELARATNGRLGIRTYPAGQIGSEDDSIGLARMGAIDFARVNAAPINNRIPKTRALCLPYVISSVEHLHRVVDGPVGEEIRGSFAGSGLIALAFYDSGLRCVYNLRRPIEKPADMKGMRLRTPLSDVFIKAIAAMGANPTPLTASYVFQALSTHLIDGAENNWPTFESARHVEMAKFWSNTMHSASPEILVMSQKRYDALSRADQDLVRDVALRSVPVMRGLWVELETKARAKALSLGATEVSPDLNAFRAVTEKMVRDEAVKFGGESLLRRIEELRA